MKYIKCCTVGCREGNPGSPPVIFAPAVRLQRKNPAHSEEDSREGTSGYPAQIRYHGLKNENEFCGSFLHGNNPEDPSVLEERDLSPALGEHDPNSRCFLGNACH